MSPNAPVQPIIIVRKKSGHGGHHGGAWKVAYADFVTAMMAFFLVMWLVGQSPKVKAGVGGYFRDPVGFSEGGRGVLPGADSVDSPPPQAPAAAEDDERKLLEAAVARIKESLDRVPAFQTLRDQVEFTVTPEGLRIDLIEKADSSFFDSGSATLHGESEHLLGVIAKELGALNHDLDIEGHTDSRPYTANDHYSNWELSADRANAARRVMEHEGLRLEQVKSVRGLADRQLRVPDDPLDPRNRRVSILVKSPLMKSAAAARVPASGVAPPLDAAPGAALPSVSSSSASPAQPH
jgi:chemotaxis protein MotB